MYEFPIELNIKNKTKLDFSSLNYERLLCLLRKEIYDLILGRKDENDYYDFDIFICKYNCKHAKDNLISKIIVELEEFGWKTQLSFGDTGLFIYSTEDKPSSCW